MAKFFLRGSTNGTVYPATITLGKSLVGNLGGYDTKEEAIEAAKPLTKNGPVRVLLEVAEVKPKVDVEIVDIS